MGDIVNSCSIITTVPNDLMAGIHNRMQSYCRGMLSGCCGRCKEFVGVVSSGIDGGL